MQGVKGAGRGRHREVILQPIPNEPDMGNAHLMRHAGSLGDGIAGLDQLDPLAFNDPSQKCLPLV